MSHLVSRILLAILMLPAASLIYLVTFIAAYRSLGYQWRPMPSVLSGVSTWAFLAIYWYGLWRGSVNWDSRRTSWTWLYAGACIVAGLMVGVTVAAIERDVGEFVGCVTAPILWLILVTLLWRETPRERAARLKGTQKSAVVCPNCGYNLTGLQNTRCPECGTQYTLDELLLGQPGKVETEVGD